MLPQPEDSPVHLLAGVGKWGLLPGIVLFFIWQMTSNFTAKQELIYEVTKQHAEMSAARADRIMDSQIRTERMQGAIVDLLRQTCINAARDFSQRQACFAAGANR